MLVVTQGRPRRPCMGLCPQNHPPQPKEPSSLGTQDAPVANRAPPPPTPVPSKVKCPKTVYFLATTACPSFNGRPNPRRHSRHHCRARVGRRPSGAARRCAPSRARWRGRRSYARPQGEAAPQHLQARRWRRGKGQKVWRGVPGP